MHAIRSFSLVSPTATAVIYAMMVVLVIAALFTLRSRRSVVQAGCCAGVLLGGAVLVFNVWPKPFPDSIPVSVYASATGAAFVLAAAVVGRGKRIILALLALAAVADSYFAANVTYQQYPTVGSLYPVAVTQEMTLQEFQQTTTPPVLYGREVGALVTLPAPPMRDALVYVPPAYFRGERLPVLVLLAGSPGSPHGWFTDGQAVQALDDFQRKHGGLAPIVVSADGTGSTTGNPACVDGPELKVQTYLSKELPDLIRTTFAVNMDQRTWTIGGLSYGGTCSLQVIANHPTAYGAFLDISGEPEPTLGDHEKTVEALFGGDEAAYQAVNPETLLRQAQGSDTYVGVAGRFIAGDRDEMSTAALPKLHELAQAAGMDTTYQTLPGGHSYAVWRMALRQNLDFVAQRGGLL